MFCMSHVFMVRVCMSRVCMSRASFVGPVTIHIVKDKNMSGDIMPSLVIRNATR